MPEVFRIPTRMDCKGIDLVHPIDRMPPGSFPYLFNVRVIEEGRIEGRPGYTPLLQLVVPDIPNSVRRMNFDNSHIYVGGGSDKLYAGDEGSYAPIDSGYSGDPLSLITFRPESSPEPWMYVYDRNRSNKVKSDGTLRAIGVAPPPVPPQTEYGIPAAVSINDGQATAGWTPFGIDTGPTLGDRTNTSSPSIVSVTSVSGGFPDWACVNPNISQPFWMGDRMAVILDPGGSNQETSVVRNVLQPIQNTFVEAIQYDDTGSNTGLCSVVLLGNPTGLQRNSLIEIDSEVIRVLEVIQSPTGTAYSIRCVTTGSHTNGAPVTGLISWFMYLTQPHANGEPIQTKYVQSTHAATGIGGLQKSGGINASAANGRPIDAANDYLHVSLFIQDPAVVTDVQILMSLDAAPNFSYINPGNTYIFTVTQEQLLVGGSSAGSWVDLVLPISSATRTGSDLTRTLANISGIAIQMTSTAGCNWGFDWWYLFGTYGPVIQPNSPTGIVYLYRYRDSSTGAHSLPGPQTRYQLFPLRESVIITLTPTSQAGVDEQDIYRQGGAVTTPLYVGTLENNTRAPGQTFLDGLPDASVIAIGQSPDLTAIQPWPILMPPRVGEVMVIGTSVIWVSGPKFDLDLLGNTVITLNGSVYQVEGQPRTDVHLEITQDAGYLASANYAIESPTLAGQSLPFAFGPLEGPFAPVIFALGGSGILYRTNFDDADSSADDTSIELSSPSSDLVSGACWNGLAFAGSRDKIYCVRYTYLTVAGSNAFQWAAVDAAASGMWSRWACCTCPIGIAYLGRDGIYITTDSSAVNITDEMLYPLFPHDGREALPVNSGSNIILPVDMTQLTKLRLTYCDESLYFTYIDTGGNYNTLVYEIYKKRWFLNNYANAISLHYLSEYEAEGPNDMEILMLSLDTNSVVRSGDDADNNVVINSIVLTPSYDGGDQRSQKLYVDTMTQADGNGTLKLAASYDNAQAFSPVLNIACDGAIRQFLENISSLADLTLYRNIGAKYTWTGGPSGPRLYAWEASGFTQPYLTSRFVTQQIPFSFPGWKHMRRMFPALISNDPVVLTILTQDLRTYGPFTIQSTAGKYRILPQLLMQNIKDLAMAIQLDGGGRSFAFFPDDFTIELKEWTEESYIRLAVFKA